MAGGTLNVTGAAGLSNSQRFNGLTLEPATGSAVQVNAGSGGSAVLTLGTITRNLGSAVNFSLPAGTQAATHGITTTSVNGPGGILGGYATVANTDWAVADPLTANLTPLTTYAPFVTTGGDAVLDNALLTGGSALTGPVTVNSLKIANSANGGTLNLAGNDLTVSGIAGGLLYVGGSDNNYTIANSGATGAIGAGAGNEFIVTTATGNLTVSAAVIGSNTGSLTKAGPGTLTLTAENAYTGGTNIAGGTLQVGSGGTTGAVQGAVVNNGTLLFNRSNAVSVEGTISGTGVVAKSGAGTLILTGTNTYSGGTTLTAGTLNLGSAGALGSTGRISFNGGTLQHSASNTADYSARFNPAPAQAYRIDTNGQNVTFASALNSSGGTFTKLGTDTLTLSAPSAYSGATMISGGLLRVAGLSATSGVTVNAGGALGGAGTIAGPVTLAVGNAGLDLQNSAASTLTLGGGLSLNAGNFISYDLGSTAASDLLSITGGTFSMAGTTTLNLTPLPGFGSGTYPLITGAAGINAGSFVLGTTVPGFSYALNANAGTLSLQVTQAAPLVAFWKGDVKGVWNINNAGNTNWSTDAAGATDTAAVPAAPTAVTFVAAGAANQGSTTLGANFLIKSLTLANGSGTVQIGGIHNPTVTTSAGITAQAGSGPTTINTTGQLILGDDQTWTNNSANPLTVTSQIAELDGAKALTTEGSGVIVLGGANTYTKGTTISSGTVRLGNAGALGTGPVAVQGTLDLNGTVTSPLGAVSGIGVISNSNSGAAATLTAGAGSFGGLIQNGVGLPVSVNKIGSGTLLLRGTHTYTGDTTVTAGVLQLGDGTTNAALAGNIVNNGVLTFANGTAQIAANAISGTGALIVKGSGILTLAGNNSYSGGTSIGGATAVEAASLVLGSATALGGGTGVVTVNPASSLDLGGNNATVGGLVGLGGFVANESRVNTATLTVDAAVPSTFLGILRDHSGLGTGVLALAKTGAGTFILGGANTFTGRTKVTGGTLQVGNNVTLNGANPLGTGPVMLDSGTTLALLTQPGGATQQVFVGNDITLNNATIRGLEGSNHLTGTITLPAGTTNTVTTSFGNKPIIFDGVLAGSGALNLANLAGNAFGVNGVQINHAGSAAYTGTITQNAGFGTGLQLSLGNDAALAGANLVITGNAPGGVSALLFQMDVVAPRIGSLASASFGGGNISLQDALTAPVNLSVGGSNADTDYSGTLSGPGTLTKVGTGGLTLSGSNFHSNTVVNQGTLAAISAAAMGAGATSLTVNNLNAAGAGTAVAVNLSTSQPTTLGSLRGTIATPASGTNTATLNNGDQLLTVNQTAAGEFAGQILGAGGLTLGAQSTQTLSLSGTNTYAGPTTVNSAPGAAGTLLFKQKASLPKAPGALTDADLMVNSGATAAFSVGGAGQFTVADFDTLKSLSSANGGFKDGSLIGIDISNPTENLSYGNVIANTLAGMLGVAKLGPGNLTLSATNTYTGPTRVDEGALVINGSIAGSAAALNGLSSVLAGTGTTGSISVAAAGGTIAPGSRSVGGVSGIGVLNTGGVNLAGGALQSHLSLQLGSSSGGLGTSDRLNVTGAVNVSGSDLALSSAGLAAAFGDVFYLVLNDASDAVVGQFGSYFNGSSTVFGPLAE
ncbi:MAG TPA: autotransporter-associated beta strand repeat-containing protein, partial [Chthoniobacteraceae bacterium]